MALPEDRKPRSGMIIDTIQSYTLPFTPQNAIWQWHTTSHAKCYCAESCYWACHRVLYNSDLLSCMPSYDTTWWWYTILNIKWIPDNSGNTISHNHRTTQKWHAFSHSVIGSQHFPCWMGYTVAYYKILHDSSMPLCCIVSCDLLHALHYHAIALGWTLVIHDTHHSLLHCLTPDSPDSSPPPTAPSLRVFLSLVTWKEPTGAERWCHMLPWANYSVCLYWA